ncbi:MAG: ABC transporter ATP-binding protein [Burkholderiales bacterium]
MLQVSQLDAFYGKKQILFGVDLTLAKGSIGAVIGPNGAGKSTVLRALFGLVGERRGTIGFDGHDLSRASPLQNIAAGVAFVPQGARVFRDLTVDENLRMGGFTLTAREYPERYRAVTESFPVLGERSAQRASALSGGERQMLAFGMALMLRPRLLLIDEPSIGLAPKMVAQVFESILRIRDTLGTAVLIVEQQAQQILGIVDAVFVIRAGQLISHGPAEKYRVADVLRQVYLGEAINPSEQGDRSK